MERIKPYLENIVVSKGGKKSIGPGLLLDGEWVPHQVNNYWRICKYDIGGHFAPHYDG